MAPGNKALVGAFALACLFLVIAVGLLTDRRGGADDQYPLDKACYSVIGRDGTVFKSWFPPVPAADGGAIFVFNNDHTWGYVFGPVATVADRDCLRERYPGDEMVPPLQGTDD